MLIGVTSRVKVRGMAGTGLGKSEVKFVGVKSVTHRQPVQAAANRNRGGEQFRSPHGPGNPETLMAINFSQDLYLKAWDVFARPCTLTPLVSQPGAPAYANRCYFDTKETDVITEDGALFSDSKTFVDIRMEEFPILPMQGDTDRHSLSRRRARWLLRGPRPLRQR